MPSPVYVHRQTDGKNFPPNAAAGEGVGGTRPKVGLGATGCEGLDLVGLGWIHRGLGTGRALPPSSGNSENRLQTLRPGRSLQGLKGRIQSDWVGRGQGRRADGEDESRGGTSAAAEALADRPLQPAGEDADATAKGRRRDKLSPHLVPLPSPRARGLVQKRSKSNRETSQVPSARDMAARMSAPRPTVVALPRKFFAFT
jgi:hypothetical protein